MKKVHSIVIIFLITFGIPSQVSAQSFYGTTGLIKIPTAEVVENGKAIIGGGYVTDYYRYPKSYKQYIGFLNIGVLPKLEVSLRVAFFPEIEFDADNLPYSCDSDRIANVKFQLLQEAPMLPAVAIGGQDIYGTKAFNSLYIVGSKNSELPIINKVRIHIGLGTDWRDFISEEAMDHRFIRVFGGIEKQVYPFLILLAEYDARDINLGVRFSIKKILNITFNLTDGNNFGCIASLIFSL